MCLVTECSSKESSSSSSSSVAKNSQPSSRLTVNQLSSNVKPSSNANFGRILANDMNVLSTVSFIGWTIAGIVMALATVAFSVSFPFWLAPHAADQTYHAAFYRYDAVLSHFDNTVWTYGTDYGLAVAMTILASRIATSRAVSRVTAWRSRGLLACYLLSVTAGGLAHQFYRTIDDQNTLTFRLLWTCCVGTVTAASGFMGAIGSELVAIDQRALSLNKDLVPYVPVQFWTVFGIVTTLVCAYGGLSYQRPACDIFIAGTTQAPSTFYVMAVLALGLPTQGVPNWARVVGVLGFILNAPLLPMYPLLVQYTNLSLAQVNTILHTCLLLAWGMQGIALRRVCLAMERTTGPPVTAVPVKKRKEA